MQSGLADRAGVKRLGRCRQSVQLHGDRYGIRDAVKTHSTSESLNQFLVLLGNIRVDSKVDSDFSAVPLLGNQL